MQTRTRGRKQSTPDGDAPSGIPAARLTRRSAAAAASKSSGTETRAMPGSLSSDPIPIRGAPKHGKAVSVASIATSPTRNEEETEFGEEETAYGPGRSGGLGAQDDDAATQEQEIRCQVMNSLLPDLKSATRGLKHRLSNGTYDNRVFAAVLETKRSAFRAILKAYEEPGSKTPFIDFSWLEEFGQRTGTDTRSVTRASMQANQVLVLDFIRQDYMQQDEDERSSAVLSFLTALDAAFPRLLGSSRDYSHQFNLALAIRTCLAIEALAAQVDKANVAKVIASVFCADNNNSDYAARLVSGPFKSLAGINDFEEESQELEQISQRTGYLATIALQDKKHHGVEKLRQEYPLQDLLEKVDKWCLDNYALLDDAEPAEKSSANEPVNAGGHDLQGTRHTLDSIPESLPESLPESQPELQHIIRRPAGVQKERSFVDVKSNAVQEEFSALGNGTKPRHEKPPSDAPSDCDEGNRFLLASEIGTSPARDSPGKRRWVPDDDFDEDDDEDDDIFETDTRGNHDPDDRRARLKAKNPLPESKRQRLPNQPPASSMPLPLPSSSVSHSSAGFAHSTADPSSSSFRADFDNIRARRAVVSERARAHDFSSSSRYAPAPPSSNRVASSQKQRHPWSDEDSDVLIRLIAERRASWSTIERKHNHEFRHPRNQQAYRDKARNLKVDFLLTDAVLPPCFDLVILSKKENETIMRARKNPWRKESDIDERGNATNTLLDDAV